MIDEKEYEIEEIGLVERVSKSSKYNPEKHRYMPLDVVLANLTFLEYKYPFLGLNPNISIEEYEELYIKPLGEKKLKLWNKIYKPKAYNLYDSFIGKYLVRKGIPFKGRKTAKELMSLRLEIVKDYINSVKEREENRLKREREKEEWRKLSLKVRKQIIWDRKSEEEKNKIIERKKRLKEQRRLKKELKKKKLKEQRRIERIEKRIKEKKEEQIKTGKYKGIFKVQFYTNKKLNKSFKTIVKRDYISALEVAEEFYNTFKEDTIFPRLSVGYKKPFSKSIVIWCKLNYPDLINNFHTIENLEGIVSGAKNFTMVYKKRVYEESKFNVLNFGMMTAPQFINKIIEPALKTDFGINIFQKEDIIVVETFMGRCLSIRAGHRYDRRRLVNALKYYFQIKLKNKYNVFFKPVKNRKHLAVLAYKLYKQGDKYCLYNFGIAKEMAIEMLRKDGYI